MPQTSPYVEASMTNKNLGPLDLYTKLDKYYEGNGLYDDPSMHAYIMGKDLEALKPLRDVANRSVEFYANKIIPGSVEVVTTDEQLKSAIEQILKWSQFDGQRQRWMRGMSKHGDLFIKVNVTDDKVFIEQIDCRYVVEFEEDARGILQEIRIEIPQTDDEGRELYYVEYWEPEYYSTWETTVAGMELDQLGTPVDYNTTASLGVNFIPIVHVKFKDVGNPRGIGCFTHALDKIDEANRQATNLAQMIFKNAEGLWVQQSANFDKEGRPMAPAPIKDKTGNFTQNLELTKGAFVRMPAGSELVSTIPNIPYEAVRQIANDMVMELSEDLPELKYYSLQPGANISGKALGMLLAGAIDRAQEAGRNFRGALVRAVQMALTMGVFAQVLDAGLGTYANGDFDHDYNFGQYFQPDTLEKANEFSTLVGGGVPMESAMKIAGYTQEEIDLASKEKSAQPAPGTPGTSKEPSPESGLTQADLDKAIATAKARGLNKAAALMSR